MNIAVVGLWHLGTVTAACLAAAGHRVFGIEPDISDPRLTDAAGGTPAVRGIDNAHVNKVVTDLQEGHPSIFEPGLEDLVKKGLAEGRLSFSSDPAVMGNAEIVWITYDTPVNEDDNADVEFVVQRVIGLFPHLKPGTLVMISSQLPVGTTRRLENHYATEWGHKPVTFCYSPENLRLGNAIRAFTQPDRIVVGVRSEQDRTRISALLRPICERIEWMSVESAEMTKHALNAFLAASVAFINEVAVLCEQVGADAKEVERGLKSEVRVGPRAYLSPGGAFAGGTLARDVSYLSSVARQYQLPTHLLDSVKTSNDVHRQWAKNKLRSQLPSLKQQTIAVWGLAYKPGTDTLRRSSAVELCLWLASEKVRVQAYDPAVKVLPFELASQIKLHLTAQSAIVGASAVVVMTEWPELRSVSVDQLLASMKNPLIIDANRFLAATLGSDSRVQYCTVGKWLK